MENAVQVINGNNAIAEITEAKVIEWLDAAGQTTNLLDNEKKMFIGMAREFGLNPFKREIHITAYGDVQKGNRKCSIITGYEVYIKRAERTGKLDGWEIKTEGSGKELKAIVKIYRKDMKYPFIHEVYYSECVQLNKEGYPNAVWAKQPRFMTKKVAIGQAFRLCFSDDLGGLPYEESDMPQEERNVTEQPAQQPEVTTNMMLGALCGFESAERDKAVELNKLKRVTWELIKKLPEERQSLFINACKDASADDLKGIIQEIEAQLNYEEQYKAEAEAITQDAEMEIF